MKILHITTGANYAVTKQYVRFINENFEPKKHTFLVMDRKGNVPIEFLEQENTIIIDANKGRQFNMILSFMRNSNLIILHSLCLSIYRQLFLLFCPSIMNKIVWVAWGMDLYQWKRDHKRSIFYKGRNLISYLFRNRIKYFVGIFPPDIDYFKKTFKSKAKTFYASYMGSLYNPLYQKELRLKQLGEKRINNSCINIQIGHSCSAILNHIEVLNTLHLYKNENIKIYIPLSYGDREYGDQVEQCANKLFGDKAVCIREMMSKEDYMDFLSTIDIAIFNTPRQIGLGNIIPLLYMEKKMFIPRGTVMYEYFKSQNIGICDYGRMFNLDYDNFSKPVDMKNAKQFVKAHYTSKEKYIERWQRIFNLSIK